MYAAYKALAEHYEAEGDYKTCIYFMEKGLDIARLSGVRAVLCGGGLTAAAGWRGRGGCEPGVGACIRAAGERGLDGEVSRDGGRRAPAVVTLVQQRKLAEANEDPDEYADANKHLIEAYKSAAEACEKRGEYDKAVELHNMCRDAARAAEDDLAEGMSYFQLGRAYHALHRWGRVGARRDPDGAGLRSRWSTMRST